MTKVTVGQLLDLIDSERESGEFVHIMGNNGNVQCTAMVCSNFFWDGIENRMVNSIQAEDDVLKIWLDDK